jgi:hypothetical protein
MNLETWSTVGSVMLFAFILAVFVFAATQVARTETLSGVTKLVWIAALFAYPLVGPGVWFLWGKPDAARQP